jgi:hypothetical protein
MTLRRRRHDHLSRSAANRLNTVETSGDDHDRFTVRSHRAPSTTTELSPRPYPGVGLDELYRDSGHGHLLISMTQAVLDDEVRLADAHRGGAGGEHGPA